MANNCSYRMKIVGEKENVRELFNALNFKSEKFPYGVGRVFSACITEEAESYIIVEGDCAWSVESAMKDLEEITGKLNLLVEVFSEEVGFAFEEHYIYANGVRIVDECVDLYEFPEEEFENECSYVWDEEIVREKGITPDNYKDYTNGNDYIRLGGFDSWEFTI